MSNLYFTIGCPRCGKSTYCSEWAKEKSGRVIVCSDDIRYALHGHRYIPEAETMVFGIKHVMIRSHLARGFDVIVDGTHSTKISVQRLLEISPNAIPILIDVPADECKRRATATNKPDLHPVIDRISAQVDSIKAIGVEKYIKEILIDIQNRGLYESERTV